MRWDVISPRVELRWEDIGYFVLTCLPTLQMKAGVSLFLTLSPAVLPFLKRYYSKCCYTVSVICPDCRIHGTWQPNPEANDPAWCTVHSSSLHSPKPSAESAGSARFSTENGPGMLQAVLDDFGPSITVSLQFLNCIWHLPPASLASTL